MAKSSNGHRLSSVSEQGIPRVSTREEEPAAHANGNGSAPQGGTLHSATRQLGELAHSLKNTAQQADSLSGSTEGTVSSINEISASIEQVTANTTHVASAAAETAVAIKQITAGTQTVTATALEMATSAEELTTSIGEIAASARRITQGIEAKGPMRGRKEHPLTLLRMAYGL